MARNALNCIECAASFDAGSKLYTCPKCGGLLAVIYDLESQDGSHLKSVWDHRRGSNSRLDHSGVWRFRELLPEAGEHEIVTMLEGQSQILEAPVSAEYAGLTRLVFKHLGFNPTGSFKDLGM